MSEPLRVVEIKPDDLLETPCCGIKDITHEGHSRKTRWLKEHIERGLKSKILLTPDGYQTGFIEYLPGQYAWRGVEATGYMFIHCLWTFYKKYQRQGYAKSLIETCIRDAEAAKMSGVAVVAREKPWLPRKDIFLRLGFKIVDTAPPDYELLATKLDPKAPDPRFKDGWQEKLANFGEGLTIIRADQCPHTIRFAESISEVARASYGLDADIVELETFEEAQNAPTPYACFAVIYNGCLLADHQISKTRFRNLMDKIADS